jgi:hypothetical protein
MSYDVTRVLTEPKNQNIRDPETQPFLSSFQSSYGSDHGLTSGFDQREPCKHSLGRD